MCGIPTVGDLRARRWESLYLLGLGYRRRGQDLQYDGERPGAGWVAHGYFARWLWVVSSTGPLRLRLWKRRWRDKGSGGTTHSRPPDELGRLSVPGFWIVNLGYCMLWMCAWMRAQVL